MRPRSIPSSDRDLPRRRRARRFTASAVRRPPSLPRPLRRRRVGSLGVVNSAHTAGRVISTPPCLTTVDRASPTRTPRKAAPSAPPRARTDSSWVPRERSRSLCSRPFRPTFAAVRQLGYRHVALPGFLALLKPRSRGPGGRRMRDRRCSEGLGRHARVESPPGGRLRAVFSCRPNRHLRSPMTEQPQRERRTWARSSRSRAS